jgi:beta-fructofuranosidase
MDTVLHFAPAGGWLNDPNGLIEHRGIHHLFFQHNPHQLAMGNMCWGHAISRDLLTWTEQPIALSPGPGSYDEEGCWSGCAVHDGEGVTVIYSGNKGGVQLPCLAHALDDGLVRWEKSADNPVIPGRPPVGGVTDMRDHSVRWDGERWRQVVAGGASGVGMLFAYSSDDLVAWSWDGVFLRAADAALPGQIWECPDVFEADGQLAAIISVVTASRPLVIWVAGSADGGALRPRRWGTVDYGDRLYAPQSYLDQQGRRIMFGWLQTQADPATRGEPNAGTISLPRILTVAKGRLHQAPAAELRQRRGVGVQRSPVPAAGEFAVQMPSTAAVEIEISSPSWAALRGAEIDLRDDHGHRMTVDLSVFFAADRHADPETGRTGLETGPAAATIFFDCGIVEAFVDGKAASFSDGRLRQVTSLHLKGVTGEPAELTVWPLTRMARGQH